MVTGRKDNIGVLVNCKPSSRLNSLHIYEQRLLIYVTRPDSENPNSAARSRRRECL